MLGFGVAGSHIRYDVPITALSAVVAVSVVGVGLFIVGMGTPAAWKIGLGGVFAGLGVNAMHYIGMAAMRIDGTVDYDRQLVGASILIAVVAATVALWLSVTVRTGLAIVGSALVMGVAVSGMHYTGMAAMSVRPHISKDVSGASAPTLLVPIVLAVILVVVGLIYTVLSAPTDEDRAGAAFLDARLDARERGREDDREQDRERGQELERGQGPEREHGRGAPAWPIHRGPFRSRFDAAPGPAEEPDGRTERLAGR